MLKGKQGRFRQNLLGKRVDYSGRSVIVVGPQLKLHQCGLPKQMALELFKPFVMKRLVDLDHAQNIKSAKRMVERHRSVVWDVLEEVITEHPVLLNRAPTLHRLGIQAFEPQLVEGKAIQIHPLVCTAFNADFDGDQMAVHVPLSAEAQAEARILMLSSNNILKPADGRPVTMPTQDMIIGLYHLTSEVEDGKGAGRVFGSVAEARMAFDAGEIQLGSIVRIRLRHLVPTPLVELPEGVEADEAGFVDTWLVETTLGRALFNETLPEDYPYVNDQVDKKRLSTIVNDLAERYSKVQVAASLDALKEYGFHWATRSGTTVAISDVVTPPKKLEILEDYETKATKVQTQFERGLITDDERRQELIEIWTQATNEVAKEMEANFPKTTRSSGWSPRVLVVTGCSCARSPVCVAWCPTRRARSSPDRSARTSARACRCSSSSSRPTVAKGSGRHRAADRRLGLPDPTSRRRVPGRHHPRGRLWHRAWSGHADRGGQRAHR
jgi:DNA-directed RNA polymerase subunit beta'